MAQKVTEQRKAYDKVFGGVNTSFLRSETNRPIRLGKTEREKAKKPQAIVL